MQLSVYATWQSAKPPASPSRIAVVIDVLRWSTVTITALAHGASRIEAASTPEQARQRAATLPPASRILGGERESRKIEGFDLGNSPREYTPHRVRGKRVITTTTNGTQALRIAHPAQEVVIGAFVNLPALSQYLSERRQTVHEIALICAGQAGLPALEDSGCAGPLIAALAAHDVVALDRLDPPALAALAAWDASGRDVPALFAAAPHAQELVRKGFADDLGAAAQLGAFDLVPRSGVDVFALS